MRPVEEGQEPGNNMRAGTGVRIIRVDASLQQYEGAFLQMLVEWYENDQTKENSCC